MERNNSPHTNLEHRSDMLKVGGAGKIWLEVANALH